MFTYLSVYRNDWGWVKIDDLVVGDVDDLQAWDGGTPIMYAFNDRGGQSDAAQIAGTVAGVIFVLTPELAPTP